MQVAKVLLVLSIATVLCLSGGYRAVADDDEYGSIVGTVVSSKDSIGLAYANVIVLGTNYGTMTLYGGEYEIKGVPPGTYTVKAMMMGYRSVEQQRVVVKAGQTTEVDFLLDVTIVMKTQTIVPSARHDN